VPDKALAPLSRLNGSPPFSRGLQGITTFVYYTEQHIPLLGNSSEKTIITDGVP
jgi:hypothetical protein